MKRTMPRWLLLILAGALCACSGTLASCGTPKPLPVVPAGQASCDQACANAVAVSTAQSCGLSSPFCLRTCRGIAAHNPAYATCVYKATTCSEQNDCGGSDSAGGVTGPGGSRTGP